MLVKVKWLVSVLHETVVNTMCLVYSGHAEL